MSQLSLEAKDAIIQQVMNRGDKSIESIARINNVGVSTLQKWLRRYREGQPLNRRRSKNPITNNLNSQEQFNHIIATHNLDDVSLGKYCRKHGLYSHQLIKWREEFMKNNVNKKGTEGTHKEIKALRNEITNLKKELRRKDKALAETSALLVLKKKANLIWGEPEDD